MISQLKGIVESISPGFAVIDVNGVGYGVFIPERLTDDQVKNSEFVKLFTVTVLTQENLSLYGFTSTVDREFFRMLLNIPRIGPKQALKILSAAPAVNIMQAILSQDQKKLAKFPGVGSKAAQRLVMELQEKVKALLEKEGVEYEDVFEEAVEVLEGLGCAPEEARRVLSRVRQKVKGEKASFDKILAVALNVLAEEEKKL